MLIPTDLNKIADICDTDSQRYVLGAVRLERDADGPLAVACDGRRLIMCRWSEPESADYPGTIQPGAKADFESMIPKKQWQEGMKLPPKRSPKPILSRLAVDEQSANGHITIGATDLETERTLRVKVPEGRFPKWRDVIPKARPGAETVYSVDPQLLIGLLSAMPVSDYDKTVRLRIPFDPSIPMVLESATGEADGITTTAVLCSRSEEKYSERLEAARKEADGIRAESKLFPSRQLAIALDLLTPEQLAEWTRRLIDAAPAETKPEAA